MALNSTAGDAAAESYFTIADADTYFAARGVATWTGTDAVKEAAARVATAYLDNKYRERWVGLTVTQTQALAWPRVDGSRGNQSGQGFSDGWTYPLFDLNGFQIPIDTVPVQVQRAAMEAALLALGGATLEPTLVRGGQVKSLAKTVGPLSKTTMWQDGAPVVDRYLAIEGLLRGLVTGSGNVKLVRS